jgi:hypothetical protein
MQTKLHPSRPKLTPDEQDLINHFRSSNNYANNSGSTTPVCLSINP